MAEDVAAFLGEKLPEGKALMVENVILCKETENEQRGPELGPSDTNPWWLSA